MGLARRGIAISLFALLSAGLCLGQSLGDIARQERERGYKLPKHAAVITNLDLEKDKIFSAPAGTGQVKSLGEIARQERERRSKFPKHAAVITNEDLENDRIFSASADTEQVAASNAADTTPQVTTAPAGNIPLWGVAEQAGFSLGEYARKLREQRRRNERQTGLERKPETPPATTLVALPERKQSPARRQHQASASQATPRRRVAHQTGARLIRVERGDSLWKLARRHFGKGRLWRLLWEANPEIRRPNLLWAGQVLRQPSDELLALSNGRNSTARVEAARVNHRGHVRRPQRYTRTQATIAHGSAGMKLIALPAARHLHAPPPLGRPVFTPIGQ